MAGITDHTSVRVGLMHTGLAGFQRLACLGSLNKAVGSAKRGSCRRVAMAAATGGFKSGIMRMTTGADTGLATLRRVPQLGITGIVVGIGVVIGELAVADLADPVRCRVCSPVITHAGIILKINRYRLAPPWEGVRRPWVHDRDGFPDVFQVFGKWLMTGGAGKLAVTATGDTPPAVPPGGPGIPAVVHQVGGSDWHRSQYRQSEYSA
ncbi:hypothetical protein OR1_04192 [Geobacter sp. OR-1]|nr:hypothetical protein OR1_04192 [Geobacter sp. OR-1]